METRMTFVAPPSRCEYLPDQTWQLRYEMAPWMTAAEYAVRLDEGWRRFGSVMFRPACPSCRMCQSLRVPTATFRASRSQRRVWKMNHGAVSIRIGTPSTSALKADLFQRFHAYQHEAKGWPPTAGSIERFTDNPFPTEEWSYYVGDRLIGVGCVDALATGLSAIYFYYDPQERRRSLGTFNVLSVIAAARERSLPHAYLGYYVAGCRSLEYKARFRPNEVRRSSGAWEPFIG